ncbi:MADF domain-containing protein [Aphis craccivora]|uniref:MADF domain-containing protein n=1 Tax=Aphis craccivora TaxID=307492 RepID=A0A6G0Y3P6_APHCR|nr:MADF domain-containing protein [Aphis craccivora]
MKWANNEVLEFLKLYEPQSQFWNPRHIDHKNLSTVHDAWKEIESNFSIKTNITKIKK